MLLVGELPKKTAPYIASNFVEAIFLGSVIGAGVETVMGTLTIPGGIVKAGDVLRVHFIWDIDGVDTSNKVKTRYNGIAGDIIYQDTRGPQSHHRVLDFQMRDITTARLRHIDVENTFSFYGSNTAYWDLTVDFSNDIDLVLTNEFATAAGAFYFRGAYAELLREAH